MDDAVQSTFWGVMLGKKRDYQTTGNQYKWWAIA